MAENARAVRIPIASARLVTPSPDNGINPKKLRPITAETRPRRWGGARSCTIVLERPKMRERPNEITTSDPEADQNACTRLKRNTDTATASAAANIHVCRRSGAIETRVIAPKTEPTAENAIK